MRCFRIQKKSRLKISTAMLLPVPLGVMVVMKISVIFSVMFLGIFLVGLEADSVPDQCAGQTCNII